MKLSDFNYDLPEERIAKHPPKVRGASRLLVLGRKNGEIQDSKYADLIDFLNPGDVLILNDTKVMKSRILTTNERGAERELVTLEKHSGDHDWHQHRVVYRGKLRVGDKLSLVGDNSLSVTVVEILDGGLAIISSKMDLLELTEKYGQPPLPPYLKRNATKTDMKRYQTIFAHDPGSAAAPTASLNMTNELLKKLRAKGVKIAYLTLHVGLGTFLPIRVDEIENHHMHAEYFTVPPETIETIREAKLSGHRVIALGTTVARTLEYAAKTKSRFPEDRKLGRVALSLAGDRFPEGYRPGQTALSAPSGKWSPARYNTISGEADIFIYPGYEFKCIDALLTNFHAPKSTVLMLAAAFAGWKNLKKAYDYARDKKYNFLSYGDSMLIL